MEMTYEKFIKIVPKETAEFIDQLLPYFDYYFDNRQCLYIDGVNPDYDIKNFIIMLFTLAKNENYKSILSQCGLKHYLIEELDRFEYSSDNKNTFEKNASSFLIYDEKSLYYGLTPLDLILKSANKIKQRVINRNSSVENAIKRLFSNDIVNFLNSITKIRNMQYSSITNQVKEEIFANIPIDVVNYLEIASKIRTLIYERIKSDNKLVTDSDKDIIPLSLFLAILFSNKSLSNENSLSLFNEILKNEGITLEKIFKKLNFSFDQEKIDKIPTNFFILKADYQQYFSSENKTNDITVIDIIKKIFNRDITQSLTIEKLLLSLGVSVEQFADIEKQMKIQSINLEKSLLLDFYSDLPKDSKDFINYISKAYVLLKKELENNHNNQQLITSDNDIIVLAFYLASVHFKTNLNTFFEQNNISLDKIKKLFNLNINLEEIEKQVLDYQFLINKFKKFVYKGKNEKINSMYIGISQIESNIYNKNFTGSNLLHNIFEELTNKKLVIDFEEQAKKTIIEYQKEKQRKLKEEFLKDLPVETIYFLEKISQINQSKDLSKLDTNDRIIISLILGILTQENEMVGFFKYLGFSISKIKEYLNVSNITFGEENFDALVTDYSKFIFEGNNKGKQKANITVYNIAKNIFSKNLNNSVFINKFFDHFNLSNDIYDKFNQLYQEYQNEHQKNVNKKLLYDKRNNIDTKEEKFLIFTIKVHKKLLEYNIDSNNIKNIAIILYLLYYENPLLPFLNKNGLTQEKVLTYLNLPQNFLDDLNEIEIDSDIFANYYQNLTTNEIKKIFIGKDEDIAFMKEMAEKLGINFKILQTEIKTEQDYEFSLSVTERIKLLDKKPIDTLDVDDIQSVIKFGDSLGFHSQYIYDELPKLMLSDANDESIASINDTLNKVYSHKKEEKPKGLFEILFAFEVEEETTEIVLDPIAIDELKEKISKNIKKLSEELLNYDTIRKYIEVYRRKNNFYLSRILNVAEELQKEVEGLDPNKEEEYADFLSVGSNLQIIKNKINRFKTSSHLMQQELVKVNQAIINHFITINALEMARDDLLPLINAELAIGKGRNTENQSLQITQNVFDLFQSLLTRNAEAAEQNMELLQKSTLSSDVLAVISQDIETYLNGLNQARQISMTADLLSIDNEKQKVLKKESNN